MAAQRQGVSLPANFDFPAFQPRQQGGQVIGDQVDDVLFQRLLGGQAGALAYRLLGPVGIAPAQFRQPADIRHGVVDLFIAQGGGAVRRGALIFSIAAGGIAGRGAAAQLNRGCRAKIGGRRHGRDMGGVE